MKRGPWDTGSRIPWGPGGEGDWETLRNLGNPRKPFWLARAQSTGGAVGEGQGERSKKGKAASRAQQLTQDPCVREGL